MALRIKGIVASRGIVKGRIKKVFSVKDVELVMEDDIVVVNDNSPLYSLAFLKAKGIISEKGGILSHLAIVAREMGKPCLLSVSNTSLLQNGAKVTLNCNKGEVIVED